MQAQSPGGHGLRNRKPCPGYTILLVQRLCTEEPNNRLFVVDIKFINVVDVSTTCMRNVKVGELNSCF